MTEVGHTAVHTLVGVPDSDRCGGGTVYLTPERVSPIPGRELVR